MKKILPVLLALVLVLALMVVPAFAEGGYYSGFLVGDVLLFDGYPVSGYYSANILIWNDDLQALPAMFTDVLLLYAHSAGTTEFAAEGHILFTVDGQEYDLNIRFWFDDVESAPVASVTVNGVAVGEVFPGYFVEEVTLSYISPAPEEPLGSGDMIEQFFGVITGVGSWLAAALLNATVLFYAPASGLTLLGVLAVAVVAIAVVFLIFRLIVSWMKFRS